MTKWEKKLKVPTKKQNNNSIIARIHFGNDDSYFCSTCPQTREKFQPVLTLSVWERGVV